jgi:sterol desaturase/sphingolipid hydroxylase (fatty acid hydroxylase superfamily)
MQAPESGRIRRLIRHAAPVAALVLFAWLLRNPAPSWKAVPDGMQFAFLQPLWDFILRIGQPWIGHWLFPTVLGLFSFFISCSLFTIKDLRRKAENKINPDVWPNKRQLLRAALPQLLIYIGGNALGWHLAPWTVPIPAAAPTVARLALEVVFCFLLSDFLIYWEHRIMHAVPFLRRRIHSVHHRYLHPFAWAGGWVHPLEDLVVILCVAAPALVIGPHPLSLWIFVTSWVALLIEEHSGYDVFWSPYRWLPFALGGGGAPHDPHHNLSKNQNFGFVLGIWDQVYGTYLPVHKAQVLRQRVAQRRAEKGRGKVRAAASRYAD